MYIEPIPDAPILRFVFSTCVENTVYGIFSPFTEPISGGICPFPLSKTPEITNAKSANPITRIRKKVRFLIFSRTAIFI